VFKARLDGVLGILTWCLDYSTPTLPMAGGLEVDDL